MKYTKLFKYFRFCIFVEKSMSFLIKLSHHDAIKLKRLLRETESSKVLKRYQCIHFKQQGIKNKDIALLLCVNIDTVTDWLKVFLEKGLMGLKEFDYDR